MQLSALTFQRQFSRFAEQVRQRSGGQPFTSFQEGLPWRWERYKQDVRDEALRLLESSTWRRSDVGKGRILQRVLKAIELEQNNLVDWPNRYGHSSRSHRALLDAKSDASARRKFEQWFIYFFKGGLKEADAFENFRKLAGNRYDLVAYLFFLKDWTRFMPIAPATFDRAFALLGIDLITARQCSWDNYAGYNEALLRVQRLLREVAGLEARLIDAHSFCWMLVRLKLGPAAPETVIPLPEVLKDVSAMTPSAPRNGTDVENENDFGERDAERRRLGRLAQDIALESERKRLREGGHPTPAKTAQPVWEEPARGYDILSCELDGTPRYIEVKATRHSGGRLSFFVTANEWRQSRSLPNYHFYLVRNVESRRPRVLAIESGRVPEDGLFPANYIASLRVAFSHDGM